MNISGVTVLRNGVTLGYPFIESLLSLLPLCDEVVVCDGGSEDETFFWLERMQQKFPDKLRLFRLPWPEHISGGQAIGQAQTQALKQCRGRWVYLLQADEILPPENVPYLRELCDPRLTVKRLLANRSSRQQTPQEARPGQEVSAVPDKRHFRDLMLARAGDILGSAFVYNSYNVDFEQIDDSFRGRHHEFSYRWAIRLARRRPGLYSGGDGWQLQGPGCFPVGTARLPRPVMHLGYNFPVNIWRKNINHAHLYQENSYSQEAARRAKQLLAEYEQTGALPPPPDNPLRLPPSLYSLIGQAEYRVREELLQ